MVALTMVVRAEQNSDSSGNGKDLQWQHDAQFVPSPPVLDLKTTARKASAVWNVCLECVASHEWEYRSELASSRLDGETSARLPLSDLHGLRGRAPPACLQS